MKGKSKALLVLVALCVALALTATTALAESGTVDVDTQDELRTALENDSITQINITNDIYLNNGYWEPVTVERNLTINGGNHTIFNMKVNAGILKPSGSGVAGDGGSCDYYAGFIGDNKASLTINDLSFSDAFVDIDPLTVSEKSTGSSVIAVVCANNTGSLVYNNVNVDSSEVRGYTKVGLLHGFTQNSGSFIANQCSVTNSKVVLEADGTDKEAAFSGIIIGYDGKSLAKTNGIKLSGNQCVIDSTVDWSGVEPSYNSQTGVTSVTVNGSIYGLTCETYTHGSNGTNAVLFVAEVNGYQYETLSDAIAAAQSGDIINLLTDITLTDDGIEIAKDSTDFTIDLKGNIFTIQNGANTQNRGIVLQSGIVTIKNGTMIAEGEYLGSGTGSSAGTGAYGVLRVEGGELYLEDITLENNRPWGMNVKLAAGDPYAKFTNVTIHSSYGGGVEVASGSADFYNCTFTQTGYFDHCSSNIAVSNNAEANIYSGTYTSDSGYSLYCFSSGGPINVYGGIFSGAKNVLRADIDSSTYPEGKSLINVEAGFFTGTFAQTADTDKAAIVIIGGNYTSDPSAYVEDGYMVVPGDNGYRYQVTAKPEVDADIKVQPGDTVADVSDIQEDDREAITNVIKSSTAEGLVAAAGNTVQNTVDSAMVEDAVAQLSEEIGTVQPEAMTIVVEPFMAIVAKEYDAEANVLTLDITPMYNLIATTNPDDINLPEDQDPTNAVKLNDEPIKMTVTTPVEISIDLPSGFNTDNLYVKHTKDNGTVYYYKVAVESATATFTVTHGFSEMMFKADSRTGKINFTYYNGSSSAVDYTPVNVGDALPSDSRSGYRFQGWLIDGVTYTTLTDDLLTKLSEAGATVAAEPVFTEIEEIDEGEYAIKIVVSGNGEVKASDKYADKGDRITLTVDPDRGYELYSLTITDADGDKVSYRDRGDGEYTFTMPDSKVTVKAVFTKIVTGLPFVDVASNAWYYDAVEYVYENELFEGMSAYIFGPNEPMNRAMLVTVLYRLEDEPRVTAANNFSDVVNNSWYEDAVLWANEHGIVEGYGNGLFKPLDNINREQIATIMYRYAIYKGMDTVTLEENLIGFVDGNKVSGWAVQAMNWAVGQGIFSGRGANNLEPQSNATRAEVAQIMMNYLEK